MEGPAVIYNINYYLNLTLIHNCFSGSNFVRDENYFIEFGYLNFTKEFLS